MIRIKNLCKYYNTRLSFISLKDLFINFIIHKQLLRKNKQNKRYIIKNLNLDINAGEIVGIIGPNGSGKSTMAKLITGTSFPSSGSVETNGKIVPFLELGIAFNTELTGTDNLYLNGVLLGLSISYLRSHKLDIFKFAGVEDFMQVPLKFYSSGMQLRLAFAIAMHAHGDIYIFDEILAVGDMEFSKKCFNAFENLKNHKKTIIIISHDIHFLLEHVTGLLYVDLKRHTYLNNAQLKNIKNYEDLIKHVESLECQQ